MNSILKEDKFLLAQFIRSKAGSIDVATRCKDPDLEAKDQDFKNLNESLAKWQTAGYIITPDIAWAQGCSRKYDDWRNSSRPMLKTELPDQKHRSESLEAMIRNRRSVRLWKKRPVPREMIKQLLEAGTYAPSAFNRLPWRFFVVETSPDLLKDGDASNPGMFASAPVIIYVAVDERLFFEKYSGPLDAAFAMQNMLLMAHHLGLGTCLVYQGEFADVKELESEFGIPEYCKVYCAILLGYPDELPLRPARMPVEEITTFINGKAK